jgi:hypothetical protein
VGCAAPPRPTTPRLGVATGGIGLDSDDDPFLSASIEFRFKPFSRYRVVPTVGLLFAEDSATYLSAGITRDYWLDEHWLIVPSFAAGLFEDGDNIRLGSELEFRSGIEFAYAFENDVRLGLGVFHLSNGGIAERNPGTESIMITLGVPVGE